MPGPMSSIHGNLYGLLLAQLYGFCRVLDAGVVGSGQAREGEGEGTGAGTEDVSQWGHREVMGVGRVNWHVNGASGSRREKLFPVARYVP